MLSGPEMARLLQQFEEYLENDDLENLKNIGHHEQGLSGQKTFPGQVSRLSNTIRQMGKPFLDMLDDFPHLVTLYSRNCADGSVVAALHTLEDTG